MSDNTAAAPSSDDSEQQVTFNIKSSSDAKHVVTVPLSSTVSELKEKLATPEYADIPAERQRLIYSGRVLKDPDTIGSCKIKDGNTVHLVKGAESNTRQNPSNQGGSASSVPGAGQPAPSVPSNIAAGVAAGDPLAGLTGARYAGFHGLPGAEMFGADGGMGAPPNPDQMLQLLEDPNFASQINEAMNNPAVLNMLRNNPMMRDNPMVREALENPEMRRMMFSPEMIRMQLRMQQAMGGRGGGQAAFPMPGQTDTTPSTEGATTGSGGAAAQTTPEQPQAPNANPFAALFPGAGNTNIGGAQTTASAQNPFGSLFGPGSGSNPNPLQRMAQTMMQNPEMAAQLMQDPQQNPFGFGGGQTPQAPADTRPPEERYEAQLRQLNDMGFHDFDRNVQALRRSGGSVQGAIEYLFSSQP